MDTPEVKAFIKDVRKKCRENGIKMILAPSMQVETSPGLKCAGYFEDEEKVLIVARKHPLYLGVLAHEASHMDQMIENIPEWQADAKHGNEIFDKWIKGKEVKNINKAINNIIALELDCEKRALKKIAEYDLPINTATYIQRANECLLYYRYVLLTRKWENAQDVTVWQKMPTRFMSLSYYKKLTPRMEQIFVEGGY